MLTTELKSKLVTVKSKKADVSSVSPSSIAQLLTLNYLLFSRKGLTVKYKKPVYFC